MTDVFYNGKPVAKLDVRERPISNPYHPYQPSVVWMEFTMYGGERINGWFIHTDFGKGDTRRTGDPLIDDLLDSIDPETAKIMKKYRGKGGKPCRR